MLIAMEHSKENEVLEMPCQAPLSGQYIYEDDKLIHETKLSFIRLLNQEATGLSSFTEDDKERLRQFNQICLDLGYPPLIIENYTSN